MKNYKKAIIPVIAAIALALGVFAGIVIEKRIDKSSTAEFDFGCLFHDLCAEDTCYVIGHKSPDTDTVCSAILLEDLLNKHGVQCEARVSGKLNNETKFVLEQFGVKTPEIMEKADGKKFILVDHSEYSQMIDGMENAEIIGLFDHHAVGNVETDNPIIYEELNVGSTATVIYKFMKDNNCPIDKKAASLIAASILSDTNNMTSNTVTELDRCALEETVKTSGIKNADEFYEQMKTASESYAGMTDEEIFFSDYKEYDMSGVPVGIACVNASDKASTEEMKEKMGQVMEKNRESTAMKHLYTMVKNGKDNQSVIFGYGEGASDVLKQAFGSAEYIFTPAASRKKDVVPKLEEIYRGISAY